MIAEWEADNDMLYVRIYADIIMMMMSCALYKVM